MSQQMQFDAIAEAVPGGKWKARWNRSWPAYRQWFLQRNGDKGPSTADCEAALQQYMPELIPIWKSLAEVSGDDDLAPRFLSTWCPPAYLGGCSLAALADEQSVHLVRNYDLSPDLNEGLLLRSEWSGTAVMGMVEFLWGLSDGINEHGLAVALAFGGSREVRAGFGITTILRYVLETCRTVEEALGVFVRVPSHMAYNVVIADANGQHVVVELKPGGGMTPMRKSIATNHQHGSARPDKAAFTRTFERFDHLDQLISATTTPERLSDEFLKPPLFQRNYSDSMGTLFTADYNPLALTLELRWQSTSWHQSLSNFREQTRLVNFTEESVAIGSASAELPANRTDFDWLDQLQAIEPYAADRDTFVAWMRRARSGDVDWTGFADAFGAQRNQ